MSAQNPDLDLYRFDDRLSPEDRQLRDRVREFVDGRFLPVVNEYWDRHDFPVELVREMGEIGCFGATIDGWGCPGLTPRTNGVIMRELERGDSGLRTMASVQSSLAMNAVLYFGSDAQKDHWLPRMRSGESLGCFGLTEPGFGSNPGGMITTARRVDGGWSLSGGKMWIGNADVADVAIIWAKTEGLDDEPDSSRSIRGFLVPTDRPGFKAELIRNKYSLRVARTSRIELENVPLTDDDLLPESGGLRSPLTCLDQARFGIAWGVIGAAEACLQDVVKHAGVREVFGKTLDHYQLTQDKMSECWIRIVQMQAIADRLADLKAEGDGSGPQVSLAKTSACESAQIVARLCRDLLGGVGILDEHCVMRHMINLESVATYEGTRDIHRLVLGRELTGASAFF
ncbi:MAG: acyl-CoA dehydrogenase [Phycisphaera sp.]|nr:acyl-CoA dehydrogenase [Phycisphaera sp.]